MFVDKLTRTKWREPFLVGRCLGAAENVRFIGCYGGSKPPPYGFVRQSNSPINQNLKQAISTCGVFFSTNGLLTLRGKGSIIKPTEQAALRGG